MKIIEKPKKTKSNKAVTGLYVFDTNSENFFNSISRSRRNEFEIADILNSYIKKNKLNFVELGRGASWYDMGTFENLIKVNSLVSIIEERQRFKIACLEEISLQKKWIDKKNINNRVRFYGNVDLSDYLKDLIK